MSDGKPTPEQIKEMATKLREKFVTGLSLAHKFELDNKDRDDATFFIALALLCNIHADDPSFAKAKQLVQYVEEERKRLTSN